ncbi:helix-turn-helix transcriptional regulator [Paracoccus lichenicola]|nr:helix-turn-helix transcriptional regulator [Paracoccus lichenicola]
MTNAASDTMVVLTAEEYRSLVEDAGDAALADAVDRNAPMMPSELLNALLNGDLHPLAAWRKAAGLSQAALAQKAGIRTATLSDIEGGKIDPRLSTMKAVAGALGVDIDDITA